MRYHEVKQDVLLQVLAIIHKHNADIAFPTQTLKIDPQGFNEAQAIVTSNPEKLINSYVDITYR